MQQEAEKTVDIDTSGPGADIEIKEEQKEEQNVESTENNCWVLTQGSVL